MKTPLTPEEADRVYVLVAEADALEPEQRAAFLAQACLGADAVRAEVESLLGFKTKASRLLASPAFGRGVELLGLSAGDDLKPGDTLGEYCLLSLLGSGGMGEVYLADDAVHGRQVALKLIGQGRAEEVRGRHFRHERRVLATLNHPHIARLYGSGVTAKGQAYLVMEYVEGERLDRYCQDHALDVTVRLALFRKVCAAVSYAHQNLVVHRDLKPANIRVTPEGEPKLLDFGIAKLLNPEGTVTRLDPTLTMQGAMTPEYASPEQIKGEAITTASDVYSLGVVLFELLTGQRPFAHLKSRRPDELARAICEHEPPRLSTVAGQKAPTTATAATPAGPMPATQPLATRLRRRLQGDLDNIVAKALRKEPGRRYPSVFALSEDIRRHLEGLPVTARKDTLGYRGGKFVRRNKVGAVAVVLVTVALVGGLVATTREARRANRRFEDVRRLAKSILFEIEPQIADLPGSTLARATLVKRALEYLDDLSGEAAGRRDLQGELAAAYEKVGDVQGRMGQPNLGDSRGALSSYHKARLLREALVAADSHDLLAKQELASCDEHLGVILWWSNQTAAAESSYHEALALWRELVAAQPRSADFRHGLASVLMRMADVLAWNNESADAMAVYQEALPILRALAKAAPRDTGLRLDLARCLEDTAETRKDLGDYAGATEDLTQAAGLVAGLVQQEPNNQTARHTLWYGLYLESETLLAQKSTARALEIIPGMLTAAKTLAESDPKDKGVQHNLAISQEAQAVAFDQAQRWPEALEAFQTAFTIDAGLAKSSPETGEYTHSCGTYRCNMGRIRLRLGQVSEAESDAQAAQELLQTAAARDPDNSVPRQELIGVYDLRGDLCERQDQPSEARKWFQRALQEMQAQTSLKLSPADADDWAVLRQKLTAKTALAGAPVSPP